MITARQIGILNKMTPVTQDAGLGDLIKAAGSNWPTTDFYCDSGTDPNGNPYGNDLNDGKTWSTAFATVQAAMDAAGALGVRGRTRIFLAPGGYVDAVTPLNADCPFGQLIGVSPTLRSFGAVYLYASANDNGLKVRARGWSISGMEIAGKANTPAILLNGDAAGSTSQGTEISNCIIAGWAQAGSIGIDAIYNGAPLSVIRNCHFNGIRDKAITCSASGFDQPRFWEIDGCTFVDNNNHIAMGGRGMKESVIKNCEFMQVGANYSATLQLDNRGGNATVVKNNFLSGTYDGATGGYYDGANAEWGGNWNIAGLTAALPA